MAAQPDPTRRLRLLAQQRGSGQPAPADPQPAAAAQAGRWVPAWPTNNPDDFIPDGDHLTAGHEDPAQWRAGAQLQTPEADPADWGPDQATDGAEDLPPGVTREHSSNSRWTRLRDRWVPASAQGVRLDPGRRGSILLSLVAALGAVVAAVGVWTGARPAEPAPAISVSNLATQSASTAMAEPAAPTETVPPAPTTIVVAVTGSVRNPGVVSLAAGSRVADAIEAAGGVIDGADYTGLNLAAKLADGDSVVVGGNNQGLQQATGPGGADHPDEAGSLVNLNTADQADLETLPGVGPVMAGNILAWRETNGPFTSVDQLQEITGIGPARFATLAPLVTI